MKKEIKVKKIFRMVDGRGQPFGGFISEENLETTLEVSAGTSGAVVLDLQTKESIYKWSKKDWSWKLCEEGKLEDLSKKS